MKIVPQEDIDIITNLSYEQIIQKLDTIIETNNSVEYHLFKYPDKLYVGYYTSNYFHAFTAEKRVKFERNTGTLTIEIKGKISEIENNKLKISISINASTILQPIFYLSIILTLVSFIFLIVSISKDNDPNYLYSLISIIWMFIYIVKYFLYKFKVSQAKETIQYLFK